MKCSIALAFLLVFIISLVDSSEIYTCFVKKGKGSSVKAGYRRPNGKTFALCKEKCLKLKKKPGYKKIDGVQFSKKGCYCIKEMRRIDRAAKYSGYLSCHLKKTPTNVINGVNKPVQNGNEPLVDLSYQYFKDMRCDTTWTKIGCYNVSSRSRQLLNYRYDIEWETKRHPAFAHSLLCACAEAARIAKVQYFATHFWGECWELDQEDLVAKSDYGCIMADGKHENRCIGLSEPGQCLGTTSYFVYTNVAPDEDDRKRGIQRGIPKRDYA